MTASRCMCLKGPQLFLAWERAGNRCREHAHLPILTPGGQPTAWSRAERSQPRGRGTIPALWRATEDTGNPPWTPHFLLRPLAAPQGPSAPASGMGAPLPASDSPHVITPCCSCYNCPFSQGCLKMERNLIPPGTETSPLSLC